MYIITHISWKAGEATSQSSLCDACKHSRTWVEGSFSRVLPYVYAIAFLVLVEYRNYSVVMVKICHGIEDA